MKLHVETHETEPDEEQPTGFFLGDKHIDVMHVVDRWPSADHVYFKVEADDGNTYILRHDENPDQWELTFFDAGYRLDDPFKHGKYYLM
jgi:hypothetical protein